LLEKGADKDLQRNDGSTALIIATKNGHTDLVTILLNSGANPGLEDSEGNTALDYAGNQDIKSLLENIKIKVTNHSA
jgi:ankyrin repeat protein